jgi:hypothetical protein
MAILLASVCAPHDLTPNPVPTGQRMTVLDADLSDSLPLGDELQLPHAMQRYPLAKRRLHVVNIAYGHDEPVTASGGGPV